MPDLDSQVDALYQSTLDDFTAARNALAKTLTGEAARQVRALKKPTLVPWVVNQVYWHARSSYESAMKAGRDLRAAQIATLKGKKADVRAAVEAHRQAIASAVHQAIQLSSEAGVHPNTEQIARMLEAVSLAATPSASPGRFTEVIAPSGFDALAGVTPAVRVHAPQISEPEERKEQQSKPASAPKIDRAVEKRRLEEERREQREAEAQLKTATRDLDRAREHAQTAREALDHAESEVAAAERRVAALQEKVNQLLRPLPAVGRPSNHRHHR